MKYIQGLAAHIINQAMSLDPFDIAHHNNINTILYPIKASNIKGLYAYDTKTNKKCITIDSRLNNIMKKFVLSHELGHAFLHNNTSKYFVDKNTCFNQGKFENEANKFAAHLLIEDYELKKYIERRVHVKKIAYELEVPRELIKIKLKESDKKIFN